MMRNAGCTCTDIKLILLHLKKLSWDQLSRAYINQTTLILAPSLTLLTPPCMLQDLTLPIEIDLLLLGFDGDGGFGYKIEQIELEELLAATIGGCVGLYSSTRFHSTLCWRSLAWSAYFCLSSQLLPLRHQAGRIF